MKLDLMDMLYALSLALDAVEKETIQGANLGHGKRVGYLCLLMGKATNMPEEELREFVGCAILHDNALAEYIRLKYESVAELDGKQASYAQLDEAFDEVGDVKGYKNEEGRHCQIGERRLKLLPFHTDLDTVLLYHHENADGSGPFGKTADEISLKSQILRLADRLDIVFNLDQFNNEMTGQMTAFVRKYTGSRFTNEAAELFEKAIDNSALEEIAKLPTEDLLRREIPVVFSEYNEEEIKNIARFFAEIVDYKSSFTKRHSMGVADLAYSMAKSYQFDDEKRTRYYFAAALHDIGKLMVPNDILEKPGKLDAEEFSCMKHHARASFEILSQIHGIEDIVKWAANHHEKLDGSGYPNGLTASELSFEERLMACIDIYQALIEDRPYKKGMPLEKVYEIMDQMVSDGQLDVDIVGDMKSMLQV